jgi:hypothetical protein
MAIKWTQSEAGDAEILAICPMIGAALGAAARSRVQRGEAHGKQRHRPFPVMIRLKEMLPAAFQSGDAFFQDAGARARWRRRVKVPAIYTQGDMRERTRIVCTAWVTRWFFRQLAVNAALRAAVIRVTPDVPTCDHAWPELEIDFDETAR